MSAVYAIEDALGIRVEGALRELRRLLYCGEWIESHTLHVAMLHAPDFLGYEDAIRMAKDHPAEVQRALDLKKAGNEIVRVVGGREIHPVNVRVGGFYRVPTRAELAPLVGTLERAREQALEVVRWVSTFDMPDFDQDYEFVALRHPSEYPFNEGRLVSNKGLDIAIRDYDEHFAEEHVARSNALHSVLVGRGAYFVGPMARYSLNFDRLPPLVQQAARDANLSPVCRNPFQSIVVRAVEVLYAVDEALRIVTAYEPPAHPAVRAETREGVGFGCTEAPRGILFHRYRLNADGTIADAKIVPPTSQNQKAIENDLLRFVERHHQLSKDTLTWKCEQAVRNYDPCISCATHFLRLQLDRQE
jgi:coenzyme F420-reducing hydrogenase alpha subunit